MTSMFLLKPGNAHRPSVWRFLTSVAVAGLLALVATAPAQATVTIKVAEPVSDPIKVRVKVQDNGTAVDNLGADDFTVTVNGNQLPRASVDFALPSDPDRRSSVIFAMDYSPSLFDDYGAELQAAIRGFIDRMKDGDFAGIVKFGGQNNTDLVAPLQSIDGETTKDALIATVDDEFDTGSNTLYDGIFLALNHFRDELPNLPAGPRAILVGSHGRDSVSSIDGPQPLADLARELGVAIYAIGLGPSNFEVPGTKLTGWELLATLATATGGDFFEDEALADIYAAVSDALNEEYLLTFEYGVAACQDYTIQVAVEGYDPVSKKASSQCNQPPPQSGGGGGAFGPLGMIAGLSLLTLRRRLRMAWNA